MRSVDLIIIGDGLVARALCAGADKLNLDAVRVAPLDLEYQDDPRSYAISPSSLKMLNALGVGCAESDRVDGIDIGFGESLLNPLIEISRDQNGVMTMIDHAVLAGDLLKNLASSSHINGEAGEIIFGDFFVELPKHNIKAPLLIVAAGKAPQIAKDTGISFTVEPFYQSAITAKFLSEVPHDHIARQLFTPHGPMGILPFGTQGFSIVWSQNQNMADALLAMNDDGFLSHLERIIGDVYGKLAWVSPRASFPLSHVQPSRLSRDRMVLIGDSAHGIHPLAGQGVNLGFRDVACLLENLVTSKRLGLDIGAKPQLNAYVFWRRGDIAKLSETTKLINKLGKNSGAIIGKANDLISLQKMRGLVSFDKVSPQPELLEGRLP